MIESMKINKLLTTVNYNNANNIKRIKYIVIHYVGAEGDAEANCKYFKDVYRGASAHYFVGHKGDVWQAIKDEDVAWHCGADKYKHKHCRNSNSIGIELCCKRDEKGRWYFTDATVDAAVELVQELIEKYDIPLKNILRHFDITGKVCPEPYVRSSSDWKKFKSEVKKTKATSYKVKITADKLNVRAGAGITNKSVAIVSKGEVFTIVKEKGNWGKLKSGKGWISLKYTKRV